MKKNSLRDQKILGREGRALLLSRQMLDHGLAFLAVAMLPLLLLRVGTLTDPNLSKVIGMGGLALVFYLALPFSGNGLERLSLRKFEMLFLLLFLFCLLLSSFWGAAPEDWLLNRLERREGILCFFLYATLFLIGRGSRNLSESFFITLSLSSALISVARLCQEWDFRPVSIFIYGGGRRVALPPGVPFGSFGNPNFFASFIVLSLSASLYLLYSRSRLWAIIPLAAQLTALLVNQTRSGYLGAALIFLLWFLLSLRYDRRQLKKARLIWLISAALFLLALAFIVIRNPLIATRLLSIPIEFIQLLKGIAQPEQLSLDLASFRLFIWHYCLKLIAIYPLLGSGIGGFQTAMYRHFSTEIEAKFPNHYLDRAHNEYLNLAAQSGLPALLFWLLFLFFCLRTGWRRVKENFSFAVPLTAVLAYLFQAMMNISVPAVAWLFWLFLGLISADSLAPRQSSEQ